MGIIINQINNALTKFLGKFSGFQSGSFELAHGYHEITIPLNICPRQIWTNVISYGTDGCGQFPCTKIGTLLGPEQVILMINVETERAKIDWYAVS